MSKRLYLSFLFIVVAIGCSNPTAHYEIDVYSVSNSISLPSRVEVEQIRLQARQHANEDHIQKHRNKVQTIIYHTPKTSPFGARVRIPSHRITTYSIEKDACRAFIYHSAYVVETRRLRKYHIRPRDIAFVCSVCLAIIVTIVADNR